MPSVSARMDELKLQRQGVPGAAFIPLALSNLHLNWSCEATSHHGEVLCLLVRATCTTSLPGTAKKAALKCCEAAAVLPSFIPFTHSGWALPSLVARGVFAFLCHIKAMQIVSIATGIFA